MFPRRRVCCRRFTPRDELVRAFICLFALNWMTGNGVVRALGITKIDPGETITWVINNAARMTQMQSAEEWFAASNAAIPSRRAYTRPPPIESLRAEQMPR